MNISSGGIIMNYNDLRDSIKSLDINDLKQLLKENTDGIISEQKYESIKLLICEYEYRRLGYYIKNNIDLKVLVKYNYDILFKISDDEIEESMEFYNKNKIKIDGLLRWIPICLSINRVYFIYKKMKDSKLSNEEIFKVFISDIRFNLDNEYEKNDDFSKDKDFITFIGETFNLLNDKRKETDIYKRMMDEVVKENSYLFAHLR